MQDGAGAKHDIPLPASGRAGAPLECWYGARAGVPTPAVFNSGRAGAPP